ncbi:hypothetical protein H4W32_000072 [Actinophytocola algeriensis]|uniref:Uncharacterized protein n=1 Tax=Actinophytocola algeriensis TaxID=1768010 RepID=A0A7W7QFG1_9PSEU|nr:hypothetical protein [Actinophytocola algeriensis]MBB4912636.1 hypothetical protein [Actinophytocola algeriensis]MBE1472030.1 hypothetical protein [Actinophytocola algeriensis]
MVFRRRCDDLAEGVPPESLIAGVGEDLDTGGVVEPVDDAGLSGLGDVGGTARTTGAAEQDPSASVADDQGFHRVLAGLPGDEPLPSLTFADGVSDADLGGVHLESQLVVRNALDVEILTQ